MTLYGSLIVYSTDHFSEHLSNKSISNPHKYHWQHFLSEVYDKKINIYDLFNIIPTIIPRPRVDIGVSGWYTGWYGKGHLKISILKISIG
jgi:hypothetical protein